MSKFLCTKGQVENEAQRKGNGMDTAEQVVKIRGGTGNGIVKKLCEVDIDT